MLILHKCLVCGEKHLAIPNNKVVMKTGHCGRRGQVGNRGGIKPNEPGIVYLVYFYELDIYKVGITGASTIACYIKSKI